MMPLDYSYTCPGIDKAIKAAREAIEYEIDEIVNELSPVFYTANDGKDKELYVKSWAESIYDNISYLFESVRKTNEDMRKEADRQIDKLVEKLDEVSQ